MNPADIDLLSSPLLRLGAEAFAILVVVAIGLALWISCRKSLRKERLKVAKAQEEASSFQASWQEEKANAALARGALAEKNQALDKLQGEVNKQNKLLGKYREAFDQAQKKFAALTSQVVEARHEAAKAQQAEAVAKEEVESLQATLARMKEQYSRLRDERDVFCNARNSTEVQLVDVEQHVKKVEEASATLEKRLGDATADVVRYRRRYRRKCREMHDLEERIQAMIARGGRIWEREIPDDAPAFVPLGRERRCPIIALLNLKGGVGKTTMALNLAATLADRGKRVLMIDCDHQRSLTSLCIRAATKNELHDKRRTLQHFLLGPDRSPQAMLSSAFTPVGMKTCSLVINTTAKNEQESDGLANVEDRLMLEWLSPRQDSFDIRFALRAALHSSDVSRYFDYVFIDCPPRLSTATINALVASDGVVIPVVLDATSATIPLPHLMQELGRLHRPELFPEFRILGVVANRVQYVAGRMVGNQNSVWHDLSSAVAATHAWHEPIHRFTTMLPLSVAYSKAARVVNRDAEHAVAAWTDEKVRESYNELANEILQRIADEAPHLAVVSS